MEQITKKTTESLKIKKKLYASCLSCGFVPFKSLNLINPNVTSIQHQVYRYVENGELEKYHAKDVWALCLTLETRDKIMKAEEGSPLYYSNSLKQFYLDYTSKDTYRLKTKKKKLEEKDFEGLTKIETRNLIKKTNEAAKQNEARKLRVLRNGEAFLFFYGADFLALMNDKPLLREIRNTKGSNFEDIFSKPAFYSFRELTQQEEGITRSEVNIINGAVTNTKMNGLFVTPDLNYGVYVLYKDIYHFSKESEINAKNYISSIISSPTGKALDGSILLYQYDAPIQKMIKRDSAKPRLHTDNLYESYNEQNVYAVPLSPEGQMIAKMMSKRDWIDRVNDLTITKEWQTQINQYTPYDGLQTETGKPPTYHLNFLIPDLGKLKRFINFVDVNSRNTAKYVIHCFDIQADLLKSSVKKDIIIHPIPIDKFYEAMM